MLKKVDETMGVRRMEGIRKEWAWTATNSAGRGASARAFGRVGSGVTPAVYCFSLGSSTDPLSLDSDGDGLGDGAEVAQNSDPADAGDGGRPGSRVPVTFTFGDPSYSHSEKYRLEITPVSGTSSSPASHSWVNQNYGECETRTAMLKPGWRYEVRLKHASTDPGYTGQPRPDYDYMLECGNGVLPGNIVVEDPDSLFATDNTSTRFAAAGKVATITVYSVVGVTVCKPDDPLWTELEESRVVLDDEELRIKIEIIPKIKSMAQCRRMFGDSLWIKTSGTCPLGAPVPLVGKIVPSNTSGESEVRVTKSRQQLKMRGLLPYTNHDGVNEMAWIDIAHDPGQSLEDSEAFSTLGYEFRGKATLDTTQTLGSAPPNSVPSESYMMSAGCELLTATYGEIASNKRQLMNQCDVFYYSGHGNGATGGINGNFTPNQLGEYWKKDLDCVVIAGCSVLNIAGYRIKSFGMTTRFKRWYYNQQDKSTGSYWENVAGIIFLGYCYTAPLDSQGAVDIATDFVNKVRDGMEYIQAWEEANDRNTGRNACAIDCTTTPHLFYYWDETSGSPVWTQIKKGATSW